MKKLLLLFAALLVAGCGEKSSSEGLESASEKPRGEPSADAAKPSPADPPVAESLREAPSESTNSLSDADVKRLLEEAVEFESLTLRNLLFVQNNEPCSGWVKKMYSSGELESLLELKDGKMHGRVIEWYESGQKWFQGTHKDEKPDGLWIYWHENGQKKAELRHKDGVEVAGKYWNSKGEEVGSWEESHD